MGPEGFAESLTRELIGLHFKEMEYDNFSKFLSKLEAAAYKIKELLKDPDNVDYDSIVELIGEYNNLPELARKFGTRILFVDRESEDKESNKQQIRGRKRRGSFV